MIHPYAEVLETFWINSGFYFLFSLGQTGSGFIRVVREEDEELHENGYGLKLPRSQIEGDETKLPSYKSNPATNDWIPNIDEHQV